MSTLAVPGSQPNNMGGGDGGSNGRIDIESAVGVKISIIGPPTIASGTFPDTASVSTLPSRSLVESDVMPDHRHPVLRFFSRYVVGHNENMRFFITQKKALSRWALIIYVHSFLEVGPHPVVFTCNK